MDGSTENPISYFEADGSGPHHHVCAAGAAKEVADWLWRQKLLGLPAEAIKHIERLIEDLK